MAAKIPNDIFQYSTTGALQAGYSSHGPVVKHLQGYGTHGLGVFSKSDGAGLDGELLYVDSHAYRITSDQDQDSHVQNASLDAGLAFVMVTKFVPEYQITVNGQLEEDALLDVFSSQGPDAGGQNSFIPFRVRGEFARVKIKIISSVRQRSSIHDRATESPGSNDLENIKGTIFGFVGPKSFAGVSVTGVHCCFLSDATEDGEHYGGSVMAFQAKGEVELSWAVTGRFHVGFPRGETWEDLDISNAVKQPEGPE
jgi:alpha-acetolactate decarboxylase